VWLSVDPLADKYPSLSPFMYTAGNPVMLVDPDGKRIHLKFFGTGTYNKFKNFMNKQLEGQFEITTTKNEDGSYRLGFKATKGGGDISKMSKRSQRFYNRIKKLADDEKTTANISIVSGDKNVHFGNYKDNKIDIDDMIYLSTKKLADGKGATAMGKMNHEFNEQFFKSQDGIKAGSSKNVIQNHRLAISWEDDINRNEREYKTKVLSNNLISYYYLEKDGSKTNFILDTSGGVVKVQQIQNRK
jgi:hypothetical protein